MSNYLRRSSSLTMLAVGGLAVVLVFRALSQAQASKEEMTDRDRLIGAWHLAHIDSPGPDGRPSDTVQPQGMMIYTRDGHMSVQLMYPKSANGLSNEYVQEGYEASFGTYDVNEAMHTLTHHVQGSITRDLLVGKDLPRVYEFTPDGHLIIRSARPEEHWSVTWVHY
jgi:hypothetical protein